MPVDLMSEFRVQFSDKQNALEYYRKNAFDYSKIVTKGFLTRLRERERQAVLELAALDPGMTFLDVGCGTGFYSTHATSLGMRVTALDAVAEMVEELKGKVDTILVGDLETIRLDRVYDRVICAGVLEFVLDPEAAFRKLCKWVSVGGKLVVLAPRQGIGGEIYRIEKLLIRARINLFCVDWFRDLAFSEGLRISAWRCPLPTNLAIAFDKII